MSEIQDRIPSEAGARPRAATRRRLLRWMAGGGAAVAAAAVGGAQAGTVEAQAAPGPEGSWMGVVTRPDLPPLVTLYTYTADGGLIETSTDHPTRSPAHGAWVRTANGQIATTAWRLVFDTSGNFMRTQKISSLVRVSAAGDEFSGQSRVEFYDLGGNLVQSTTTASSAKRIRAELPPATPPAAAQPSATPTGQAGDLSALLRAILQQRGG